ncbi:MAG: helix-turn-helix transcriptional regulator [Nostoc sp. NMS7]|uniref:helix-turn-helix domain-containing protein n=1 Tax=Nostoc sp. NMS7 TaxID=2815391 RepID=UPI0025DE8BD6|nr:helix-turn-helix transcriptional regulator [Nostoc sp. NMS7]MBN3946462.1 helix-turn-helix transcriptional regulator [Nostoc sp. NMS7]
MPQLAGLPILQNLNIYRVLGENIKILREESFITQLELADHLGISNDTLSKMERGKQRTEYAIVSAIAEIFGTTPEVLATKNSCHKILELRRNTDRLTMLLCAHSGSIPFSPLLVLQILRPENKKPFISTPPLPEYSPSGFANYCQTLNVCNRLRY